ncbi:MAG: phage tail protein [Casimicrobiaceae bacterium]
MPMSLRATSNVDQVFDKLDAWASSIIDVAMPRAANKLIDQAQTAGFRKVNDIYRIGPRTFEKYARVQLAKDGDATASITVKGAGFPLYLFNPRQVRGKGGGVRVTLKGRTFLIPHAFIAKMKSGHVGVFARGAYGGKGKIVSTGETFGKFHFGKKRFSINELFTFSAPGAFSNPEVTKAMNDRVEEQYGKVINAEIRFASR